MLRFIGTYGDCHVFFPWKTGYLEHFHGIMPKDKKDNPAQLRRRRRRETFDCIVKHNYFCLCVWLLKLSACKCSWCPLDFWPHVFGLLLWLLAIGPGKKGFKKPCIWAVQTSHLTLPQPHIRSYSTRTARTLTFDPTLPKIRNPSRKKQHCPVHIRPYPTFPGSHSTLPHMRPNSSRFTFDPTSNQPSVNQPPLNNCIHWHQINQPPLNNYIHCYQINQPPLNNYIHWYQINQPPLNNYIHWYQINQPPLNNYIHWYQINQPPLHNYIHWYQINQPPLNNYIHWYQINQPPLHNYIHWYQINQPPWNNYIHWYQVNQTPLNNYIHWYQINQPPLNNYIHWYQINQPPLNSCSDVHCDIFGPTCRK